MHVPDLIDTQVRVMRVSTYSCVITLRGRKDKRGIKFSLEPGREWKCL